MTRAKKSFGQHWLVNQGVADRIVDAAELGPDSTVLEVGPGTGVLTGRLAERAGKVVAVEKDRSLVPELREKFTEKGNVTVVEGDILEIRPADAGITGPYIVVANLPYYITSHFLRVLLTAWPPPGRAIIMIQKEVARRMAAAPPDMNMLALSVQAYADASRVMDVAPGSFNPPPDVESSVVIIRPRMVSAEERAGTERALAVAKRAFAHKRKKITSSVAPETLSACSISPSARPQELTVADWMCLSRHTEG
ncbi:MAG TPA: 16S rRNA (adenine(1518)-N(6)/adenine(1519)-N(6))-dimethyltransferase RsmA [Candidatus Paceibacterota bacterium]|nr:16S rRNA (adenine(1518)-N(6)/adenine(1519)-N(6))-dimethyltransferase RsmA [Candidatus Paceibacterota bacterium]